MLNVGESQTCCLHLNNLSDQLFKQEYFVADASEGQLFVCASHNATSTHLYISEAMGIRFSLSLENIVYFNPLGANRNSWLRYLVLHFNTFIRLNCFILLILSFAHLLKMFHDSTLFTRVGGQNVIPYSEVVQKIYKMFSNFMLLRIDHDECWT